MSCHFKSYVMSCHVLSYPVLPSSVLPCHFMSCHVCHVMLCHDMYFPILSCFALPCLLLSCQTLSYPVARYLFNAFVLSHCSCYVDFEAVWRLLQRSWPFITVILSRYVWKVAVFHLSVSLDWSLRSKELKVFILSSAGIEFKLSLPDSHFHLKHLPSEERCKCDVLRIPFEYQPHSTCHAFQRYINVMAIESINRASFTPIAILVTQRNETIGRSCWLWSPAEEALTVMQIILIIYFGSSLLTWVNLKLKDCHS